MNVQKNVPFPCEKEQEKSIFNFTPSFLLEKNLKNCSVKHAQPAFCGVKELILLFLPVPEAQSISFSTFLEWCNPPQNTVRMAHNRQP